MSKETTRTAQEDAAITFTRWAEENDVSLEDLSVYGPWWQCYAAGYNAALRKAKETLHEVF